jgi:metallo-beta-lactamase family protein
MRISFLGAAGTVTGSKYLVRLRGSAVLVDCGLFQGFKQLRLRNREHPSFDPALLDAVVLTHAHIDHSGYLPLLVRNGYEGPVYCTAATRDLCGVLLPDSGRLQEEEAEGANRHGYSRHSPALPLYTEADAHRALEYLVPIDLETPTELTGDLSVRLHHAGHILGAAMVRLTADGSSVLFSGDLGRPSDPIIEPPVRIDAADYLVVESTYGDRDHDRDDPLEELATIIRRTVGRGGAVIVPAFAVGRAQLLLWMLHQLKEAHRIPDIPVYLDSPMAAEAGQIVRRHVGETRLSPRELDAMLRGVHVAASVEQSKALDERRGGSVIVSASGMATGGRVLHHIARLGRDPRNTILFTGFQAGGTRGADLLAGKRSIKIHGEYVHVAAEVAIIDNLSSHADRSELLAWLSGFNRAPHVTYVTHGEPAAADALRRSIEERLHWRVRVPEHNEVDVLRAADTSSYSTVATSGY